MKYVGIDGCKGGWFAVCLDSRNVSWIRKDSFSDVLSACEHAHCVFVDIPIGLPASGTRDADTAARQTLPSHLKSSIFNTPVRQAVHAEGKAEARSINQKLSGKSLSEQSLGIAAKIREVDQFMQSHPEWQDKVFESHPEICFTKLAGGEIRFRKKDFLGGLERFRIISTHLPDLEHHLNRIRSENTVSKLGSDDMLDAFVLAVAARKSSTPRKFLPDHMDTPPKDETGLPMAIWYA